MGVELGAPIGLAAALAIAAAVIVWRRQPPPLSRRMARVSLGARCVTLALITLALAGFAVRAPASGQTLIVVADRSSSLETALGGEAAIVRALRASLGPDDRFGVVAFGGDALVEEPPEPVRDSAFSEFATHPDGNATDIDSALRLAASLMPPDTRKHIVVLSDGRQNLGDALAEARVLRQSSIRVDVIPVSVASGPEVYVDSVEAPSSVPDGAGFQVRATVVSNTATTATVTITEDGSTVAVLPEHLAPGESPVSAVIAPAPPGLHDVHVSVDPAQDTLEQNNSGDAVVDVLGPQRVLVVEGSAGEGGDVAAALQAAGVQGDTVDPAAVPETASGLAGYQGVALVDVSSAQLGSARMEALRQTVDTLGIGLSVFGGGNTLGPGGLAGTPLETALPVTMQIRSPQQKAPVAVVLVLESVESATGDAVVRGAARALIEKLNPQDYVGVTDARNGLAVPLQQVGDRRKVEDAIASIQNFGDPPSYEPFMADAADALAQVTGASKHIIVLGDGDAQQVPPSFVAGLVANHITVSAVGVDIDGNPAEMASMRQIADQGQGRFYQSESPAQVPDILLQEAQTALKPWINQEPFLAEAGTPTAALAGVDPAQLPAIGGYVATTPKAAASVALYAPGHDPLLATWQYGLGHAAVWTSDTAGRWTSALLASPQGGRLLAGIVASTLPLQADPTMQLTAQPSGASTHVTLRASAAPAEAGAHSEVVAPDGTATAVDLVATAPGRYEATVPLSATGVYTLRVTLTTAGRTVGATTAAFAIPYSPEFRFLGTDRGFLTQLAAAGGGATAPTAAALGSVPLPATPVLVTRTPWLLAAALVVVVAEIALRRLSFRSGDARAWAAVLRPRRDATPAPAEATISRLRRRVDESIAARTRAPAGDAEDAAALERTASARARVAKAADTETADLASHLLQRRRQREKR